MLFRRLVLSALLVGAGAGLLLTAVQYLQVIPLIQEAEQFEGALAASGGETQAADAHGHDHAAHDHDHGEEAHGHAGHDHGEAGHADGIQRSGFTLLSNAMIGGAFALVMMVAMTASLRGRLVSSIDWRKGVLWGAAGYAIFFLAPALSMPPDIPGAAAAPLDSRQLWWAITALCTAGGLAMLAFVPSSWRWAGLALLAIPHVVGAPQGPEATFGGYPAAMAAELEGLARQFVAATALANGLFWLALGVASAWAMQWVTANQSEAERG